MTRILDKILRGDPFTWGVDPDESGPPFPLRLQAAVAERFEADSVSATYWRSETQMGVKQLGVCRPPFPVMWIEGRVPNWVWTENGWEHIAARAQGFLLQERDGDDGVLISLVNEMSDGGIGLYPYGVIAHFDDLGMWAGGSAVSFDTDNHTNIETATAASRGLLMIPLLATSLMNCRNVRQEPAHPPKALSKKHQRKHGRPLISFTRIVVPTPSGAGSVRPGTDHGVKPLHVVRGHFKHYTEDAPLFGKHVGSWWWSWAVRGKETAGIREHTYVTSGAPASRLGGTP